jgi:serine protease Do
LIWYGGDGKAPAENDVLSTTEIAEGAYPSIVLICAKTTDTYRHGTGFFIRADGYIATNYHILKDAVSIEVSLYSGKKVGARLVGYDESEDLAVLKISGISYPVLPIGNSDLVRVGERAIAIGHPSGPDADWTTTQGIVSAVNRKIAVQDGDSTKTATFIQTDAPVNQGNSGGVLLNDRGKVIGIVNRKLTETEGIGFAIPINHAIPVLDQLMQADQNQ